LDRGFTPYLAVKCLVVGWSKLGSLIVTSTTKSRGEGQLPGKVHMIPMSHGTYVTVLWNVLVKQ